MQSSLSYPPESSGRVRRNSLDFVAIFFSLAIVSLVLAVVFWQFWHSNRIYSGVRVAGHPIGGMTRLEAMNTLNQKLQPYPLPPVILTYEGQQWPLTGLTASAGGDASAMAGSALTGSSGAATVELVSAVNRAYLIGRDESLPKQLQDQLVSLLIGINVEPQITFNRAQLRHSVSLAAVQLHSPARPPKILNGQQIPGQDGLVADVEATMQMLLESLRTRSESSSTITSPFIVQRILSETMASPLDSRPAAGAQAASQEGIQGDAAETVGTSDSGSTGGLASDVSRGSNGESKLAPLPSILLQGDGGYNLAIDSAMLRSLLFSQNPLRVDRDKLAILLNQWADQVYIAPRDARLQFNPGTGTVNILQTSRTGRRLDVEATEQMVMQAIESLFASTGGSEVAGSGMRIAKAKLVIQPIDPAVDMNKIPQLGIRELVASGTTYFAGSSAARIRNIEVAASKFKGVVIPPGEQFSFNRFVEDVSSANGFEDSLIIWGDQTAVGVGGGVCQVSTTIFRAAYAAGLPIVERYNHGYVVSWYGEPGLDATIYTPTVDFRFRNDTGAHLLVDPVVDSLNGVMTFNLYGTKPNRQVIINEPVVSEVIQPEPPRYKVDEELATGEREQVEWEKEGKTIEVTRAIIEDGETRTDTITSKYQPWQAVILVGPGTLAESESGTNITDGSGSE